MKNPRVLEEFIVKADIESLNDAIAEKHISPEKIVSVLFHSAEVMAIGDSGAKFRVIYRI